MTSRGFASKLRVHSCVSLHIPDKGKRICSFLIDASNPDRVDAGGSPVDIYRSENRGKSWLRLPRPGIAERAKAPFAARAIRMAQHPARSNEIYAALEVNGVIRTAARPGKIAAPN